MYLGVLCGSSIFHFITPNFSNYLLDQTVVQDNHTGAHGTVWSQYADSLVKNDPNRYQYVQTPDFLKGIDY